MNELEARISSLLRRYMPALLAESVRQRAQSALDVQPGALAADQLERFAAALAPGIALFVPPPARRKLVDEIRELASAKRSPAPDLQLRGKGYIELEACTVGREHRMTVRAAGEGHGIPNLDVILAGNYRSRTGLGRGLLAIKRLAVRFDVQTTSRGGQDSNRSDQTRKMRIRRSRRMHKLMHLALSDTIRLGSELRKLGDGAANMEEAAHRVTRHLYTSLTDERGTPAHALVRLYKSHPYGGLPAPLQRFASNLLGGVVPADDVRCLTLLATTGSEPAWNDRSKSGGHQAIPLPSEGAVEKLPMILQLVRQLGLEVSHVVKPRSDLILELDQQTFNVFFVERARGSDHIPAQDQFVVPHAIESAIGFGGMLPNGDMFSVIGFSRVPLTRAKADLFKTLALNVKLALLPFVNGAVFAS